MLKKINFEGEEFNEIVGMYYEKENFHNYKEIFKNILRFYDEIKENTNSYSKIFNIQQVPNPESHTTSDELLYSLCMHQIKLTHADFYLLLVKYLNNFCEETLAFIKVILHIDQVIKQKDDIESEFKKKINLQLKNTNEIFRLNNTNDLKINTFVEICGNIKKISNLKQVNTKLNVYCSTCGIIFTKNLMKVQNNAKMLNVFGLNNDKKFHQCENMEDKTIRDTPYAQRIYKEYSHPISVRLDIIGVSLFNENSAGDARGSSCKENNTISCIASEEVFKSSSLYGNYGEFPFWKEFRLYGVVKTRPEGNAMNKENFFEKIVEILYIVPVEDIKKAPVRDCNFLLKFSQLETNSLNIFTNHQGNSEDEQKILPSLVEKLNLDVEDFNKIIKLSSHVHLSSFFLMSLVNSEIPKEINFVNVLLEYFLFSKDIGLKIHLFNGSRTENFSSILNSLKNFPDKFLYHDFKEDPKSNEELVTNAAKEFTKFKSEDFNLKFGKIFSSHGKFLVLDNIPNTIPANLYNFLSYNNCMENFNITSFQDLNSSDSNFQGLSSILTTSEILDFGKLKMPEILSTNLSQLTRNFDLISFYSDKMSSDKDRKKTNKIIENQFNNRKRKFPYGQDSSTQDFSQNIYASNNIDFSSTLSNDEELYALDSLTFAEFHNGILKNEFHQMKNDNFLNQIRNDKKLLNKFLTLANEFIPKISPQLTLKIKTLSQHLMKSYSDLSQFELKDFDDNGENLEKILRKLAMINSRIELKFYVEMEHVVKAYIFTKEIVQQNFIFLMNNKVDTVNKTKRNKISFVIEKIKQMCANSSRKVFTKTELKESCEVFQLSDDIDTIIENLNFMGFMIKLNSEEYQIIK